MSTVITETSFPNLFHRGKVRDMYEMGQYLLMVATDRISAFDVVLPNGIPDKGAVLAQLSAFWFQRTAQIVPNHLVAMGYERSKLAALKISLPGDGSRPGQLATEIGRRSMVVKKAKRLPVECVVRGYITGSAWAEYKARGVVTGVLLPAGLQESQRLPQPVFTPTTKAEVGHDQPLTYEQVARLVGHETARDLRDKSLEVYDFAHSYAIQRGVIIADTKFEFGFIDDKLCLIDEVLTPDSSRFWSVESYKIGRSQDSLDKQIVRDWLVKAGWNKEPPAPRLPEDVVSATAQRYGEVFRILTGTELV